MAMTLLDSDVNDLGTLFADGTHTMSFPGGAVAAGTLIVVAIGLSDSVTVSSIDDAGTTTFSQVVTFSGNAPRVALWVGIAAGASAGTSILVTLSGNTTATDYMAILAFTSANADQTSLASDGRDGGVPNNNTHATTSITPTTAENVIVGLLKSTTGTYTGDVDFTELYNDINHVLAYKIQSAATAQAMTVTSLAAEFGSLVIAAFKGTAAGRASKNIRSNPLGVNLGIGVRIGGLT